MLDVLRTLPFPLVRDILVATCAGPSAPTVGGDSINSALEAILRAGVPAPLLAAARRIAEMAHDGAMDVLLSIVGDHSEAMRRRTPKELAARAWLGDRATFDLAHARCGRAPTRRLRLFLGRGGHDAAWQSDHLDAAAARLSVAFVARGWGRFCRIDRRGVDGFDLFMVSHGTPRRATETCDSDVMALIQGEGVIEFRPMRRDRVYYDRARDLLAIEAIDVVAADAYRSAFGELLHADPTWFAVATPLTLRPLAFVGTCAVAPTVDVDAVDVVGLEFTGAGSSLASVSARGPALLDALARLVGVDVRDSEPVAVSLRVCCAGVPGLVEVRPPNLLQVSASLDATRVFAFLAERGFLAVEVTP